MEIFIAEQCKTLAESCIMGLIFGAGYDIIRILHVLCGIQSYSGKEKHISRSKPAFWLFLIGDLAYMLTVLFWTSVFLFHTNYGQFRIYLALGCIAGFCLYQYTAGRVVMRISETIAGLVKCIVYCLLVKPTLAVVCRLCKVFVFLWRCGPGKLPAVLCRIWCLLRMHRIRKNFRELVRI